MPKIIKNAKEQILLIAKEELRKPENGSFSMRSIAKKCHMAVGTLYNYYPDKLNLIAEILLEEWKEEYETVKLSIDKNTSIETVLSSICQLIMDFRKKNHLIFSTYKNDEFGQYYQRLHTCFVAEIENLWCCSSFSSTLSKEENQMIAEMILIQTRDESISFSTLCSMIIHITRR